MKNGMTERRSTLAQDIRASSEMMRTVEGKPMKNVTSLNYFEEQKVGNSTSYSYNKEQLA